MQLFFLSHLLGVGLLLSQFPSETIAGSKHLLPKWVCKHPLVDAVQKFCEKLGRRNSSVQEELAIANGPPSEFLQSSFHTDAEALNILVGFIPDLPQEMKATLSDGQSSLRKQQDSGDLNTLITSFSIKCCKKKMCA
nr:prorelaxin-like [Macaca nemestrina]